MGYDDAGENGISYITATGVAKSAGMSVAAAREALQALQAIGLATSDIEGNAWRPDTAALAGLARSR